MIAIVVIILALLAFVGVLIWSVAPTAPRKWRERIVIGGATLFVMLPPLGLALGAVT